MTTGCARDSGVRPPCPRAGGAGSALSPPGIGGEKGPVLGVLPSCRSETGEPACVGLAGKGGAAPQPGAGGFCPPLSVPRMGSEKKRVRGWVLG